MIYSIKGSFILGVASCFLLFPVSGNAVGKEESSAWKKVFTIPGIANIVASYACKQASESRVFRYVGVDRVNVADTNRQQMYAVSQFKTADVGFVLSLDVKSKDPKRALSVIGVPENIRKLLLNHKVPVYKNPHGLIIKAGIYKIGCLEKTALDSQKQLQNTLQNL